MKTVEAVKTKEQIAVVSHMLEKHGGVIYRDIWQLGINLALRISDLLDLAYSDFAGGGVTITVIVAKTGKTRIIKLNDKVKTIVAQRQALNPTDLYIFQSVGNRAKSLSRPLSRETVARKFAEVGVIIGVHLGTHSMRKTRGFLMWDAGVPLEVIARVLNHSSPAVTMRYIGLDQKTVDATYDDFVL
jgi:integrase